MKKRALFLIAIFALVCMLAICVGAEENTNTYYLVQTMDSEAAAALQAEGKSNIVTIAELTSNSSTEPGEFFNNLSDGASVEFVLAENVEAIINDALAFQKGEDEYIPASGFKKTAATISQ